MQPVLSLPRFGGFIKVNEQRYSVINTCSIDTWLAVLKAVHLTTGHSSLNSTKLNVLYDLVRESQYDKAKFHIGMGSSRLINKRADFYGNEWYVPQALHVGDHSSTSKSPHVPTLLVRARSRWYQIIAHNCQSK